MLQRYLTLTRQGEIEEPKLTLNLQNGAETERSSPKDDSNLEDENELDETAKDAVKVFSGRDRKNAQYILKKLSKSNNWWTRRGEFVREGRVTEGSHLDDLLKSLLSPFKRQKRGSEPAGWGSFLHALHKLNIPVSSINNPHVREEYLRFKTGGEEEKKKKKNIILSPSFKGYTPSSKKEKKKIILSPSFDGYSEIASGKWEHKRPSKWVDFYP